MMCSTGKLMRVYFGGLAYGGICVPIAAEKLASQEVKLVPLSRRTHHLAPATPFSRLYGAFRFDFQSKGGRKNCIALRCTPLGLSRPNFLSVRRAPKLSIDLALLDSVASLSRAAHQLCSASFHMKGPRLDFDCTYSNIIVGRVATAFPIRSETPRPRGQLKRPVQSYLDVFITPPRLLSTTDRFALPFYAEHDSSFRMRNAAFSSA
ncbi:hypothetical protein DM02DRAFT_391638 [Periconia macrospinosa]|uniref:Uncharacterized protein n=1 Tax=Periconia macrospinosa TaxID=97972 RepID=A0A2V1DRM8_9PLEO|nr:hypothetical protein DM02DRAFT_391638 [Periconia macrospinosa]